MSLRIMWALAFGILLVAGQTYGERPFRETARIPLRGGWQAPAELVGDDDVATTQIWISQDGNMALGSSYSTGEAPGAWGATDILLFDGVASQVSATSGLDLVTAPITVARIDVTDNFIGDIGLPGTPFQIASVTNVITMRGSGTMYLSPAGGEKIFVDSPNHLDALVVPSGIILGLYVKEGHATVGASTSFAGTVSTMGPYATVAILGAAANTGPHSVHCWDGIMDLGLRGALLADPTIKVGGGLLRLHKTTGTNNYTHITQTGGIIDFDILEGNGALIHMQLIGGTADFRKCQYVFSSLGDESYIGPAMQIIPGPATTEAILKASGIEDFRLNYP